MRRAILAALLAALAVPAAAQDAAMRGLAGPYLAARLAGYASDYRAAADYYGRLVARGEATPGILENAVVVNAALGRFETAARIAERLDASGEDSQFGATARLVDALEEGDWDGALSVLDAGPVGGTLLDGLVRGWVLAAQGEDRAADDAFDALRETEGFAPFALLAKAYRYAMEGDWSAADEIFSGRFAGPLNLTARGIAGHAQVLSQLGRDDDAVELLRQTTERVNSPALDGLLARAEAGETLEWDVVTTPAEGMAEAYFTLAALLSGGDAAPTFVLVNARAATVLRPDLTEAVVLTAAILDEQRQHDLAAAVLRTVPADDPAFFAAEVERAETLIAAGREEAALEVLQALTRSAPDRPEVWAALGDTNRRMERFADAAEAYDRAIAIADAPDWFLHYARGIARERSDDWDGGEADFRRALELNPDQPNVLNYLGYGLVEQRRNLDEALGMIERAVAARPNDGYITDSLAWVLYRLGRAEEAVAPMERAVELMPRDPIVNDHLGDILWTVGREREAEFQWRRALSLDPEPEDKARILRKLEVGLDAVLGEEGGVGAVEAASE